MMTSHPSSEGSCPLLLLLEPRRHVPRLLPLMGAAARDSGESLAAVPLKPGGTRERCLFCFARMRHLTATPFVVKSEWWWQVDINETMATTTTTTGQD